MPTLLLIVLLYGFVVAVRMPCGLEADN